MQPIVVTKPPRADQDVVAALGAFGVATVHEVMGRTGLCGSDLRSLWSGARAAGTAVTVECPPGDNLMIHVAVEQTQPGDVLVVTTISPSTDGFIGELLVTALVARDVRAVVTTTGVRDVAAVTASRFPLWSRAVSAQGTVKATPGAVNVPIAIAGTVIRPGDVVIADDDGVLCVPRLDAAALVPLAAERMDKEDTVRAALRRGELGLDLHGLRPLLERLGVPYVPAGAEAAER